MLIEIALKEWVDAACEIQADTGFWPSLDNHRLRGAAFAFGEGWEGAEPLDEMIAAQRGDDPALRAVVGAVLWFLQFDEPDQGRRELAADAFERFLEAKPVPSVDDPKLLRWELHAAGAGRLLTRILEIGRRFDDLRCSPDLLARVATTAFLATHPNVEDTSLFPSGFDPEIHGADWVLGDAWDLLTYSWATLVPPRASVEWTEPTEFTPAVLEGILQVETLLRRVALTTSLTPTQQAITYWCSFALGVATHDAVKLASAASGFAGLPPHPLPLAAEMSSAAKKKCQARSWAAATGCFARGAQWPAAVDAARTWAEADPQDHRAHQQLAEALYKDGRIVEAIDAYEKYVRTRQEGENDWEPSLLLQLGLHFKDVRHRSAALEAAALETAFRPQGEALVGWVLTWFPHLSPKARERWWVGMFTLSSPHVITEIGDARWDQAADCFGEAVAFELKEHVFRPFSESHQTLTAPDKYWERVLACTGTLGQMIEILLQARSANANTVAAKELGKWLLSHHPDLLQYVKQSPPKRLLAFAQLRGQAQHGSVNEAQTRQVFTEAAGWLQAIGTASA